MPALNSSLYQSRKRDLKHFINPAVRLIVASAFVRGRGYKQLYLEGNGIYARLQKSFEIFWTTPKFSTKTKNRLTDLKMQCTCLFRAGTG